jgi:hypothetical protein
MAIQFRTFQYSDYSVKQEKLEQGMALTVRVSFSQVRADNIADSASATSVLAGQCWILSGAGQTHWSSWTTGDVVEALVDAPSSAAGWAKVGSIGDGTKVRVSAANAAGGLASEENNIGTYTGTFPSGDWTTVDFITPADGVQCINNGSSGSLWENDLFVYNSNDAAWSSVSPSISIGSSDNALEFDTGELSHRDQLGHEWTNPNGYNPGIVLGPTGSDISAAASVALERFTIISATAIDLGNPSGGTYSAAAGEYVYQNFGTWQKMGDRADGDVQAIPSVGALTIGSWSGNESKFAVWDASGGTYTYISPHVGDRWASGDPEVGSHIWRGVDLFYNGTAWMFQSQDPQQLEGDTIDFNNERSFEVIVEANGGLQTGSGGVSIDAGNGVQTDANGLSVDPGLGISVDGTGVNVVGGDGITVDGTGVHADLKANAGAVISGGEIAIEGIDENSNITEFTSVDPGAKKSYVDYMFSTNVTWREPTEVLKMESNVDQSGVTPTASETGEAWVVNNWSASYTDGDIVEWDGAQWDVIVTNDGGEPPEGTRVTVNSGAASGDFAGNETKIGTYSSSAWSFTTPSDGWAQIIVGDGSVFEDSGFNFNGTNWVLMFSGAYSGGNGIDVSGNVISADAASDGGITNDFEGNSVLGIIAHDGITVGASGIAVAAADGSITINGTGIAVTQGDAITLNGTGLTVDLTSDGGLQIVGGGGGTGTLAVDPHDGITVGASGVAVDGHNGITVDGNGVSVTAWDAIAVDVNGVQVDLTTNGGLRIDGGGGGTGTLSVDPHNGIQTDANGVSVKTYSAGGIIANGGDGSELAVVAGDGITVTASGVQHYQHYTWETPTTASGATHTFAAPAAGTLVEDSVRIYRNGQLLKEVTSGQTSGEYTWDNANRRMVAGDAWISGEEVAIVADLT